ncbi:MAG: hypothetical protein ACI9JY_001612, partial [Saprospiraceae bacterium]
MKKLFTLLLLGLILPTVYVSAQSCATIIADNRNVGGIQLLRTFPETMVVRGNYSYSIEFSNEEKGVVGVVFSKGGELFNQDDELIFTDGSGNRKTYRFIEMGEMTRQRNAPVHKNILQLDLAAIDWFTRTNITTIYIKNNISNQMRKLTVNLNRQVAFKNMARCFQQTLNASGVRDKKLVGNDFSAGSRKISSTGNSTKSQENSGPSVSSTGSGRTQETVDMNDSEVKALRKELADTKVRLREEILAEKAKADGIKSQIQEEIKFARTSGEEQKAAFAQEVLAARQRSQKEISNAQKAEAASVQNAKAKATTEIEKISLSVQDAKSRATDEISKTQLLSAEEVAAARQKAADEIKLIKDRTEMSKVEYADEIASARENSSGEIQRIREEAAQVVEQARERAKGEQTKTAEEVVTSKKTASEQILKVQEDAVAEVAALREKAALEKEKLALELAETRR